MSDDCVVFSLSCRGHFKCVRPLYIWFQGSFGYILPCPKARHKLPPSVSHPWGSKRSFGQQRFDHMRRRGLGLLQVWLKNILNLQLFFFLCFWSLLFVILQVWCLGGTQPSVGQCHQIDFPESHVSHAGPENRQVTLLSWEYVIACNHKIFLWSLPCCLLMLRYAVVSCGSLSPPDNGKKVGTWYLEGDRVRFSCNNNYQLQGSSVRVCQSSGQWSGEEAKCVVPSMFLFLFFKSSRHLIKKKN